MEKKNYFGVLVLEYEGGKETYICPHTGKELPYDEAAKRKLWEQDYKTKHHTPPSFQTVKDPMDYVDWCVRNKQTDTKAFEFFCRKHGGKEKVREKYKEWKQKNAR